MVTTKTSNNTSVGLKEQLQVALAGAIGMTAGVILWEAFFPGERTLAWRFAGWIKFLLVAGSVTLAWARGVCRHPQQAAKLGALTGMIVGGAVDLVFAPALWIGAAPGQPLSHQIDVTILAMFRWGLSGFLGGLAIEKGWGQRSAFRVALGVAVAALIIASIEAVYEQSFDDSTKFTIFADAGFWRYELSRRLLPAFAWALAIFLSSKSDDVLQRQSKDKEVLSGQEIDETPRATQAGLKDQLETALTATIGVSAGLILWYAIFESGMLAWNRATLVFLLSIGFSVGVSIRYLDPFFERVRGSRELALESRSRLRRVSLLSVSAAVPVAIFMQLNDKLLTDNPEGIVLWLVAAVTAGTITLAWARGLRRSPARAAEFGALTGVFLVGFFWLALRTYAVRRGFRSVDESIAMVINVSWQWGLYGLLGGLAIERWRGTVLAIRLGLAVGVAGLIVSGILLVASGALYSASLLQWVKILSQVFCVAVGWAWGITLFAKSDDVLTARQERS